MTEVVKPTILRHTHSTHAHDIAHLFTTSNKLFHVIKLSKVLPTTKKLNSDISLKKLD